MTTSSAEQIQAYIDQYYLSEAALAERAEVSLEQLQRLQAAQCIPVHSYELRDTTTFTSTFGDHALARAPRRYYHPCVAAWLSVANERAQHSALAVVAAQFREDFAGDFEAALDGREPPWPGGVDYAWAYLMDGTWGLCLKEISAQNMLIKEFARGVIRRASALVNSSELSREARQELEQAIASYRRVVLPFAPHERGQSSTALELEVALEKYAIT